MGHTGLEQLAGAVVALAPGGHKTVQILPQLAADTECTVALQVVVVAAAGAGTSPVGHAAAAAAVAVVAVAAAAAVAIENSVILHSHSSHIRPIVQEEDVVARARAPGLGQTAIEDYMLVGIEAGQPRLR